MHVINHFFRHCVSLHKPKIVQRLTKLGYSHTVTLNKVSFWVGQRVNFCCHEFNLKTFLSLIWFNLILNMGSPCSTNWLLLTITFSIKASAYNFAFFILNTELLTCGCCIFIYYIVIPSQLMSHSTESITTSHWYWVAWSSKRYITSVICKDIPSKRLFMFFTYYCYIAFSKENNDSIN